MRMISLIMSFALCHAIPVQYDGHQVIRIIPSSSVELDALANLQSECVDLDFWLRPSAVGRPVDIRLSPSQKHDVLQYLVLNNIRYAIHIEDVQLHLNESLVVGDEADWDTAYHNNDDINKWMHELAGNHSDFVSVFEMGKTYEGRTVYGLKISANDTGSKPQIYYDGGIHAREWIAHAVVQYMMGQLINNYGRDAEITDMVNKVEWHMVPAFNADGYVYTWEHDRMWRKTRQPNSGSSCVGTDPCRNADAGWGGQGSSNNPCSGTYHGASPFSSPIVKAASVYLATLKNLKGYINFHSNAQSWLTPYGYTNKRPTDYSTQEAWAKEATDAIRAVNGERYPYGPAYTTIYPASGIISDWVYDKLGVVLSQATELRGSSFSPPASLIKPNGAEIFAAAKAMAKRVV